MARMPEDGFYFDTLERVLGRSHRTEDAIPWRARGLSQVGALSTTD